MGWGLKGVEFSLATALEQEALQLLASLQADVETAPTEGSGVSGGTGCRCPGLNGALDLRQPALRCWHAQWQ